MNNPLVIKSIDLFSNTYERIGITPLTWDRRKKRFVYAINHRKLRWWYFKMSLMFFATICCFYIFVRRILSKGYDVPWFMVFMQGFAGCMGIVGCSLGFMVFLFGTDFVYAWDNMYIVDKLLISEADGTPARRQSEMEGKLFHYWLRVTLIGVQIDPRLSVIVVFFFIRFQMDPFYYIFKQLFLEFMTNHGVFVALVRIILVSLPIFEYCRLQFFVVICGNAAMGVITKAKKFIKRKLDPEFALKLYGVILVLLAATQRALDPGVTVIIFMLQIVGIAGLSATIAMRKVIPMPIYLFAPYMALYSLITFQLFLVPVCDIYEDVKRLIHDMRHKTAEVPVGKARALFRRKIKAVKIFTIRAGIAGYRLFYLKRTTKTTFVQEMVSKTLAYLMSPIGKKISKGYY